MNLEQHSYPLDPRTTYDNPSVIPPQTAANEQEVEEAVRVCVYLIDNPPEEYRITTSAIQGLVCLTSCRQELRPLAVSKVLKVIQEPKVYR